MKDYKKGLVTAGITTMSVGITSTVTATVPILKKLSNFSSIATIIAVALTTTLAVTFFTSLIIDKISSREQEGITKAPIAKVGEQSKDCDINNDNCEKSDQECAPLSRKEDNPKVSTIPPPPPLPSANIAQKPKKVDEESSDLLSATQNHGGAQDLKKDLSGQIRNGVRLKPKKEQKKLNKKAPEGTQMDVLAMLVGDPRFKERREANRDEESRKG